MNNYVPPGWNPHDIGNGAMQRYAARPPQAPENPFIPSPDVTEQSRAPQVPPGVTPQEPPPGAPHAAPINWQPYQPPSANWQSQLLSRNMIPSQDGMLGGFNRFNPSQPYAPGQSTAMQPPMPQQPYAINGISEARANAGSMGNFWDRYKAADYAAPHVLPAPAGQEQALLASLPTTRPSKTGQSMSGHLNNGMFSPTSRFPRKI